MTAGDYPSGVTVKRGDGGRWVLSIQAAGVSVIGESHAHPGCLKALAAAYMAWQQAGTQEPEGGPVAETPWEALEAAGEAGMP